MERIHGVDASWLHHSGKDHHHGRKSSDNHAKDLRLAGTSPEILLPTTSTVKANRTSNSAPSAGSPRTASRPRNARAPSFETSTIARSVSPVARKGWLSSFSSRFSSSPTTQTAILAPPNVPAPTRSPSPTLALSPGNRPGNVEKPYVPAIPKQNQPSFLTNAFRRLSSSGGGLSGSGKGAAHGLCERRTLNVDKARERCGIPDLTLSKLRRVAFCVDVEIAGTPRYNDEEDDGHKREKRQKKEVAEREEGEALKHLGSGKDTLKDRAGSSAAELGNSENPARQAGNAGTGPDSPNLEKADEEAERKAKRKEKKKQSEEERKARKEKRKKQAQINGRLPVELTRTASDQMENSLTGTSFPTGSFSPTTDPVRIYRRCCQLRETPILKKIADQLSNPSNSGIGQPGCISTLDLKDFPMSLPDLVTLGDYLAVVPIKDVILENCGLTDEGVRVVLAGLLATKQPEYGRRRRRHNSEKLSKQSKQGGVVERLILKKNPKLGRDGWGHISLFIYMCRSIRYLDLSLNPFPSTSALDAYNKLQNKTETPDAFSILSRALAERRAKAELELLNMAETAITTDQLGELIDGVIKSGLRRLAIAGNHITEVGMDHVARFVKEGRCEGLDIGGNDIAQHLPKIADSLSESHPLWALGLADCNLTPDALSKLLPTLAKLPNFKFIDLSHNHGVFETIPSSLSLLRTYIPKMPHLKRLHLADTSMSAAQAIALAEILPESHTLAHVIMAENPALTALANAKAEEEQEEACALYASLLCAARVSKTIICLDVDVPSPESSEIVKALAKQVVAYCLRNIEHGPVAEVDQAVKALSQLHDDEIPTPDVLLHIVGHMDGTGRTDESDDEPAPDEDYIISGTGVAKALNICLRNSAKDGKQPSSVRNCSDTSERPPVNSLASTNVYSGKAKEMSKNLLDTARIIRARLQAAMLREARANERQQYKRLQFLDQMLQGIIKRFEDEFPETRVPGTTSTIATSPANGSPSGESIISNSVGGLDEPDTVQIGTPTEEEDVELSLTMSLRPSLNRVNSEVSIASKAQTEEEGRVHRAGQQFRRDLLKPPTLDPAKSSGGSSSPSRTSEQGLGSPNSKSKFQEAVDQNLRREPLHLRMVRDMAEEAGGPDMRKLMDEGGPDGVIRGLGTEELKRRLIEQDPECWAKFKEAQEKAYRNSGLVSDTTDVFEDKDGAGGGDGADGEGSEIKGSNGGGVSKTLNKAEDRKAKDDMEEREEEEDCAIESDG